ncbi:MAG: nucleoside hydrolase [Vicinamibacteria bacterium]|nr:nucleoside hydrolase [Vicinamibacteria bacterium]
MTWAPFALTVTVVLSAGVATPAEARQRDADPRKVIVDADPGIDDAMAILFALRSPALEVLGITTVFGNAHIDMGTANALRLVELAGRDVPVARGAAHPLILPLAPPPEFVHGTDGLGNIAQSEPTRQPIEASAAEFIVSTARRYPGEVTLLAIGRLTNLALALALEPRLPALVREVVLMGGSASAGGNVTPVAEANIWGDPHAADIVLGASWKVTMVGLDVTTSVRLGDDRLERMAARDPRVGGFVYRITRFYKQFHDSMGVTGGFYVHDPSAVAYLIDPGIFSTDKARVRVVTEGIAMGQTIADSATRAQRWDAFKGRPEVTVCRDVDGDRLLRLFETTLTP